MKPVIPVDPPGKSNSQHEWYGWRAQNPDSRDYPLELSATLMKAAPIRFSLRDKFPPVLNQGALGSCVWNALAMAYWFDLVAQGLKGVWLSRLYGYFVTRVLEGTQKIDSGVVIRDACKVLAAGCCLETLWPYVIPKFAQRPPAACYKDAPRHHSLTYKFVPQDLNSIKATIASGRPFPFGFTAYESFESAQTTRTGIVTLPTQGEAVVGGHCMLAAEYDDTTQMISGPNSWGDWGVKGWFTMPYSYLLSPRLASDFWVIQLVTG